MFPFFQFWIDKNFFIRKYFLVTATSGDLLTWPATIKKSKIDIFLVPILLVWRDQEFHHFKVLLSNTAAAARPLWGSLTAPVGVVGRCDLWQPLQRPSAAAGDPAPWIPRFLASMLRSKNKQIYHQLWVYKSSEIYIYVIKSKIFYKEYISQPTGTWM